jgi:hypothetical protein
VAMPASVKPAFELSALVPGFPEGSKTWPRADQSCSIMAWRMRGVLTVETLHPKPGDSKIRTGIPIGAIQHIEPLAEDQPISAHREDVLI